MRSAILAALLCCAPASAAPVPPGESPPPGKRPATPAELAAGRKAYEAIGGRYFLETAYPEQAYHQFILPQTVKPEDFAKLPDLPFEYWLDVELGPDVGPGTLKQLGRLKNLRHLTLTGFSDPKGRVKLAPLVAELAGVPNLDYLAMGYPHRGDFLSDEFVESLGEFKSLRTLAGSGSVTDTGLEKLARHPTLDSIRLSECPNITDTGLAHLAKMKRLRTLNIGYCAKLTPAALKPFAEDPRLTALSYGGPGLTEETLAEVEKIWTLETLSVMHYRDRVLSEDALRRIGKLPRLRILNLPSTKFTDEGFAALTNAGALERLSFLYCADITDAGVKSLTRLACLKSLTLFEAPKVTDAGLKELAKLPRLETLSIKGATKVTDEGVKSLLRAETLTGLYIEDTGATEKGVRAFIADRGPRLKELGVRGMPVNGEFVVYLAAEAPNLVSLDLSKCDELLNKHIVPLAALSKLRYLDIYHTGVTNRGIDFLRERLPQCRFGGF